MKLVVIFIVNFFVSFLVVCVLNFHFFEKRRYRELKKLNADGKIDNDGIKSVCARISIIRELSREEIDAAVNTGKDNTGVFNSGNSNSGNFNSGNRNSGRFCACNYSSGVFMSKKITYEAFDKQLTETEYYELINSKGFSIVKRFSLYFFKTRTKKNGLKRIAYLDYKASWRMFWQTLTPQEKLAVKRMPHFDADVFYEITGIRLG